MACRYPSVHQYRASLDTHCLLQTGTIGLGAGSHFEAVAAKDGARCKINTTRINNTQRTSPAISGCHGSSTPCGNTPRQSGWNAMMHTTMAQTITRHSQLKQSDDLNDLIVRSYSLDRHHPAVLHTPLYQKPIEDILKQSDE
jgi:hypothetical protein